MREGIETVERRNGLMPKLAIGAALDEAQTKLATAQKAQATSGATAQKLLDVTEQLQVVSAERDRLLQSQATVGSTREALAEASRQRDAVAGEKAATEQRLAQATAALTEQRALMPRPAGRPVIERGDGGLCDR
jgi:hypothetical protein